VRSLESEHFQERKKRRYQGNGLVSGRLKVKETYNAKEISNVEAVSGGIKATVDLLGSGDMMSKGFTI
jgi:hypothetical protein